MNAIKLERRAEMYQWKETSRSETRKKLGGGEESVTTYEYSRTWSDEPIESSRAEGHENPSGMPVSHQTLVASRVTLGAFTLSEAQVGKLDEAKPLRVTAEAPAGLPAGARVHDGGFFIGANPGSPAVGDVRVAFRAVRPQTVSLVARQVGDRFDAYAARAGDAILLVKSGAHSAEAMSRPRSGPTSCSPGCCAAWGSSSCSWVSRWSSGRWPSLRT